MFFYDWILLHWVYVQYFLKTHLSIEGCLGCFHHLVIIVNSATVNVGV